MFRGHSLSVNLASRGQQHGSTAVASRFVPSLVAPMGSLFWSQAASSTSKISQPSEKQEKTILRMLESLKSEVAEIRKDTNLILKKLAISKSASEVVISSTRKKAPRKTKAPQKSALRASKVKKSKKAKQAGKVNRVLTKKIKSLKRAYNNVKRRLERGGERKRNPSRPEVREEFLRITKFKTYGVFNKTLKNMSPKPKFGKISTRAKTKKQPKKTRKAAISRPVGVIKKSEKTSAPLKAVRQVDPSSTLSTTTSSTATATPATAISPEKATLIRDAYRIAMSRKPKGVPPTAKEVQAVTIERVRLAQKQQQMQQRAVKQSKSPSAPVKPVVSGQRLESKKAVTSSSKSSSKFAPPVATTVDPVPKTSVTPEQKVAIQAAYQEALKRLPAGQKLPTAADVRAVMLERAQQRS